MCGTNEKGFLSTINQSMKYSKTIFTLVLFVALATLCFGNGDGNSGSSSESSSSDKPEPQPAIRNFTRNYLDPNTGARCLDGTPPIVYTYEGKRKDKFIIVLPEGVMCLGGTLPLALDQCIARSKTDRGSSNAPTLPQTKNFQTDGFLSADPAINPNFHDWSKAWVHYCDGALFLGEKPNTVPVTRSVGGVDQTTQLYFRGGANLKAALEFLNEKFGLYSSKQLVFTGRSAGAISILFWGNYLQDKLKHPEALTLISDSGIFTDFIPAAAPTLPHGLLILGAAPILRLVAQQQAALPFQQCFSQFSTFPSLCVVPQNAAPIVRPPVFIIQSLYDPFSLVSAVGLNCLAARGFPVSLQNCTVSNFVEIERFKDNIQAGIKVFTDIQRNGAWGISCSQHIFTGVFNFFPSSDNYVVQYPYGDTINQAVADFLKGKSSLHIDQATYPDNAGCNGITPDHCAQADGSFCITCEPGYILFPGNRCIEIAYRRGNWRNYIPQGYAYP